MLVEFRVKNFRSIKDEQVLSMVASKDDSLPSRVFEIGGVRLLKAAFIYGANASGKSNLLRALYTMCEIVRGSAQPAGTWQRLISPFSLGAAGDSSPTEFEIVFVHREVRYQYGFTCTRHRIYDEWLTTYPKGRPRKLFQRRHDARSGHTRWKFGASFRGEKETLKHATREDSLFVTQGAQLNHKLLKEVYDWLTGRIRPIWPEGRLLVTPLMLSDEEADAKEVQALKEQVTKLLAIADPTVAGIDVEVPEQDGSEKAGVRVPSGASDDERLETLSRELKRVHRVKLSHRNQLNRKESQFNLADESSGVRRMFELSGPWLVAMQLHFVVLMDEIESSLHPLLARHLVERIFESGHRPRGMQLIAATHDITFLDPELLRRDQIWFTHKGRDGATELACLYDYDPKPRKGEQYSKSYLAGRYGAIPILDILEAYEDDEEAQCEEETQS